MTQFINTQRGSKGEPGERGLPGASINSASFDGNDIVYGLTDGSSVRLVDGKTELTGPQGNPGQPGQDGAAATISVGTTTTGNPGTNASVTNSGTSSAAVFNFTIPRGANGQDGQDGQDGAAATITAGTATGLPAGSSPTVTNSGSSSAAVFNFGIPAGATGATGNGISSVTTSKSGKVTTVTMNYTDGSTPTTFTVSDGADGQGSGDVIGPNSSTQGHLATFADGTGKVIQDGGAIPVVPTNVSAFNNDSGYVTSSIVSDTAYGSSWDGVTGTAPSKNAVYDKINGIDGLIPSAATSSNKLTDKNYVDDSINSVTAYYITKNAAGDQFATYAELAAATTFYSGGVQRTPTRNDYCIVVADENHDNATTRYIYNTNWEYQYTVNETALTTAQLNALNSGITSAKVTTYDGYASTIAGKQDALSTQTAYTTKGTSTKVATISTNTLGQVTGITETSIDFPVTSVNGSTGAVSLSIPSKTSDLNNDSGFLTSSTGVTSVNGSTGAVTVSEFNPGGTATTGYVLKKTADGYGWDAESGAVTSVNGQTGAVTVSEFTPTSAGTTNQVLTKTANGYDWATPSSSTTTTATLTTAGWSSKEQTVSVTGVTASNTIIVSPAPANINDYASCSIYCSAQGSGTLTFKCNTVPSDAITVNVLILS